MSKTTTKWLIAAGVLILLGIVVSISVLCAASCDLNKLKTRKFETNEYEITDEFNGISVDCETADVVFSLSSDGKSKVVCYEEENFGHSVSVAEGVLTIKSSDTREWYDFISFDVKAPTITIYSAKKAYSDLVVKNKTGKVDIPADFKFESINVSVSTGNVNCAASAAGMTVITSTTGNILIENTEADSLELSATTGGITVSKASLSGGVTIKTSTGKVVLTDVSCKNVDSTGSTGDIRLKNVVATEKIYIERSTGDVRFDGADAAEIYAKTSTGDVTGTLLSEKIFNAETSTGEVKIPASVAGGSCKIVTSTGDIKVSVRPTTNE